MKVWLITVGEPLPVVDPGNPRLLRTGVFSRRLAQKGHEVTWWTSTFDHYQKRHRADKDITLAWEGVNIRLLRSVGYGRNTSPKRFIEHVGIARKFAAQAPLQGKPDIILASLPTIELAREAVRYGIGAKVPVILDVRDLWPDALLGVLPKSLRLAARVLLYGMTRDVAWSLGRCDGIIGISPSYLNWGLRHAGRGRGENDGMFPLGYISPVTRQSDQRVGEDMRRIGIDPSKRIVWYIGSFGAQYDLGPVLDAAKVLRYQKRGDILFVISGDGERAAHWHRLAHGADNVIFTGWIDGDRINWLRDRAAIGLQPYVAGAPQGLANKLFEYLSAGIPVVSSLLGENEALLAEYQCGLTYGPGDSTDCLAKLLKMIEDDNMRTAMGMRGKALFDTQFDGTKVYSALAAHLEGIVGRSDKNSAFAQG